MKLHEIKGIISGGFVGVIQEVVTELNFLLDIVNGQHIFLKEHLGDKKYRRERYIRNSGRKTWEIMPLKEQEKLLGAVRGYSNLLYTSIERMSKNGLDPRENFNQEQNLNYGNFLNMARNYSKDLKRQSIIGKTNRLKHPSLTGSELETDQKIVASACILAYEMPVTIYTLDKGILTLVERIRERTSWADNRARYGIKELPQNNIGVYNPYLSSKASFYNFSEGCSLRSNISG